MKKIPLWRGRKKSEKYIIDYAIVDNEYFEWLNQWEWKLSTGYARRQIGPVDSRKILLMHREIVQISDSKLEVDHINMNRLDNRKFNLRIVTSAQNRQNLTARSKSSSPYRGVSYRKDTGKWRARAKLNWKDLSIGHFDTELEAVQAIRKWRIVNMPFAIEGNCKND